MPVIKVNDLQHPLHPGQNRLGGGDADIPVDGDGMFGTQAVVDLATDDRAVIRRQADGAGVRVNGIALVDPTPLIHGDKIEVGGTELYFYDDSKLGATSFVSASEMSALALKRPGAGRATASTGGRLVSLVDGKEYTVGSTPLTMGRDAACSVVIALNEVSRKHAEVAAVDGGYEIRDLSANGLFVNGDRVQASRLLSRADVIRIGSEEFRFHADSADALARAASPVPQAVPAPAAPVVAPPTAPPADVRPVLAHLEIMNEGPTKGRRHDIRVPLAHVGRGAHNDVVIADPSVSETHAKFQLRDDGWYLVDVDSTNGTYVSGKRLMADRKLEGSPDVRFGGVKMQFKPHGMSPVTASGTRAIAHIDRSLLRQAPPDPAPAARQSTAPAESSGRPAWIWIVVALAGAGAAAFFLSKR